MPQGPFPKQDQPCETLLLDGSDPPLGIGVQIRAPGRQKNRLDSRSINGLLKRRTELAIPVVDQLLPRGQEAPIHHGDFPRDLHHPALIGMRGHPRHMDPTAGEMDKEQHVISH
jgi:hypothetical protein